MIKRDRYLNKLIQFKDKKLIKIITGIRRCGKSTLFKLFIENLIKSNVKKEQIIFINFENLEFEDLLDYKKLYKYIESKLKPNFMNYIFLDEIQNVKYFEKVSDSLFIKDNVDLYLTGSNAYMLSSEIATLLSGRYVEIKMLPLSFKEYTSYEDNNNRLINKYNEYITLGSFPYISELQKNKELIRDYLDGIFSSVILKDVVSRKNIGDIQMLESVVKYLFDNIGNITSLKKISDSMTSYGRKISSHTIEKYIDALTSSFIIYTAKRYDIKGKEYLKTLEKYYVVDIGLRYYLLGNKNIDFGRILENIVYLELIRNGYDVYIGKIDRLEVDFVAVKGDEVEYYQVAYTTKDEKTLERELLSLKKINDNYPKYLITMDEEPISDYDGIKKVFALDFLMDCK